MNIRLSIKQSQVKCSTTANSKHLSGVRKVMAYGLAFVIFSAMAVSCTDVDDSLGTEYIPENQLMQIGVDTFTGIDAFLAQADSFPSSRSGTCFVGSITSPIFGKTTASSACQFIHYTIHKGEDLLKNFGTLPVADSLNIDFIFNDVSKGGDTSKTLKINIFLLNKRIKAGVDYYSFIDLDSMADMSSPVATFEYNEATDNGAKEVSLPMSDPRIKKMVSLMMDRKGEVYTDSDIWYDKMPGFYFKVDQSSPEDAYILPIMLSGSDMSLYMHNYKDETGTTIQDSLIYMKLPFDDDINTYPNTSVNSYRHDYSNSQIDPLLINDTLPSSTPIDVAYAHGAAGVVTYLRFTDSFVNDLKSKIVPPFKSIVINKAVLEIELKDKSIESMDQSLRRLGMYKEFKEFTPIGDYDYAWETSSSSNTLPYGGYINRTYRVYRMDISSYIQELASWKHPQRAIFMGPSYQELVQPYGVVLNTSNKPDNPTPMKVTITYTLIL